MTGLNCSWGSSVKEGGGRESITRHKLHRRTHYLIPMQNWSQADRVADHSKQIIRPKGTKKEGCDHAFSLQKKFCSDIITSTIQTYSNQTKSNQVCVCMRTVCVVLYIYIRVCVFTLVPECSNAIFVWSSPLLPPAPRSVVKQKNYLSFISQPDWYLRAPTTQNKNIMLSWDVRCEAR